MNPSEYIIFKKKDFLFNCTKENGFTDTQANEFFEIVCNYIERLEKVKDSENHTGVIVEELIKYCTERPIWMGSFWSESKYNFIIHWLTKAVWMDRTYYWSKIHLGQYMNAKTNRITYDVANELMSESELFELLNGKELKRKYTIENNLYMQVYKICKKAFDCNFHLFREGIEAANFTKLKIQKQNIVQDLTYRLSGIMGENWYTDVCKNMNWKKSVVSGQGKKLEVNIIIKKLNRILPRPEK